MPRLSTRARARGGGVLTVSSITQLDDHPGTTSSVSSPNRARIGRMAGTSPSPGQPSPRTINLLTTAFSSD